MKSEQELRQTSAEVEALKAELHELRTQFQVSSNRCGVRRAMQPLYFSLEILKGPVQDRISAFDLNHPLRMHFFNTYLEISGIH